MTTYNFRAIINHPLNSVPMTTPDFNVPNIETVAAMVKTLMASQPEASSFVITIVPVKQPEEPQAQ